MGACDGCADGPTDRAKVTKKIELKEKDAVEIRTKVRPVNAHRTLQVDELTSFYTPTQIQHMQMEMQKQAAEAARGAVASH